MKKFLVIAVALAALGACAPDANAQTISGRLTIDQYSRDYRQDRYEDRRYQYNNREMAERRFYARQRSYYRGRCDRRELVVTDPYTQRRVCVNVREFNQFLRDQRRNRYR